mmetsp:Transcript_18215/g.47574  ORF Transcript_18215/g.47574 Transcript_18215/m.47574 type:complete len:223 (+) Transcript_18215:358-1026(+)
MHRRLGPVHALRLLVGAAILREDQPRSLEGGEHHREVAARLSNCESQHLQCASQARPQAGPAQQAALRRAVRLRAQDRHGTFDTYHRGPLHGPGRRRRRLPGHHLHQEGEQAARAQADESKPGPRRQGQGGVTSQKTLLHEALQEHQVPAQPRPMRLVSLILYRVVRGPRGWGTGACGRRRRRGNTCRTRRAGTGRRGGPGRRSCRTPGPGSGACAGGAASP